MKKIYKYGTGQEVPKGAIYLGTITQTEELINIGDGEEWIKCWFVWHYFLVEVNE